MEKNRSFLKTRPLTKNEKILLSLLGIFLFIFVYNNYIYIPQAARIEELEGQKQVYNQTLIRQNSILRNEKEIEAKLDKLNEERNQVLKNYFPVLDQSQILYVLSNLTNNEGVNVSDMTFSRPTTTTKGDMELKRMNVNLPISGTYSGIYSTVDKIATNPRRIIIDSLSLNRDNSGELGGNLSLAIYSLEGLAETERDIIRIDVSENRSDTPFLPFTGYVEDTSSQPSTGGTTTTGDDQDIVIVDDGQFISSRGQLLYNFDNANFTFIPSNNLVKGSARFSNNSRSGRFSLRFEYNILALERENRAYIDLSRNNIELKYPPNSLGLWAYSYGYSPGTLGLRLKTQTGDIIDTNFTQGINWMEWSYLEASMPSDLSLYPLYVDKIFFEIPNEREDYGVLLLDQLEANYSNISSNSLESNPNTYDFYLVEAGDNISSISTKLYGSELYKNEIMSLNNIRPGDILEVGRVLVLKKR